MTTKSNPKDYRASYKALMYYEGTPCPMIVMSVDGVKQLETCAEEMIKTALKEGHSLKDQIAHYTGQMGSFHTKLEISELKYGAPQEGSLNLDELKLWWLNCFALLRLKAIKTDENYGLFEC